MKIYQLIYTSAKYSLTDDTLGLTNRAGYGVYSCSQGLTKDDINDVMRFCGYRLPKGTELNHSKTPFDPSVPNLYPKMFRTFKTQSGKYAAIRVCYSGCDFDGEEGNFFAHALICDDVPDGFYPESLYTSKAFRSYLTAEETEIPLVRYLPVLDDAEIDDEFLGKVDSFVQNHRIQMSAVLEQAIPVFTGSDKTHICISAKTADESAMYVLGLKRILPHGIADSCGISTNNVFLPSPSQDKIIINGTVTGKNNITDENIDSRPSCVYIDVQRIETDGVKPMKLFEMSMEELYKSYEEFSIENGKQLMMWLNSYERLNEQGVGERLGELYDSVGENLFKQRAQNLYSMLSRSDMKQVKYEILEAMAAHIDLFGDIEDDIIKSILVEGVGRICMGEPKNMENIFKSLPEDKLGKMYDSIDDVMKIVLSNSPDDKSATLLLRIFSFIRRGVEKDTWREFFKDKEEYLVCFTNLAAMVMISDSLPIVFTPPALWSESETAEAIAFIDASTEDEEIRKACFKYVLGHKNEAWQKYGIRLSKKKKSKADADYDLQRVRKMLSTVGYAPYQRATYKELKFEVLNDMAENENPLLLVRLLNAVFTWQSVADRAKEAEKCAEDVYELIMELKENEISVYKYVFPKLALEILDSSGMGHEIMINADTMDEGFWNWFAIGFKRSISDEVIRINYERVFEASRPYIKSLPVFTKLNKLMK